MKNTHATAIAVRIPCALRASPAFRDMVVGTRPRIPCLPDATWDALARCREPLPVPSTASPCYKDVETFVTHRLLQREMAVHARVHYVDLDRGLLVVSRYAQQFPSEQNLLELLCTVVTRVLGVCVPLTDGLEVFPMTAACAYAVGAFLVDPESAGDAMVRRFGRERAASVTADMLASEAWQAIS